MCRNLAVTAAVASTLLATPTLAFEVLQPLGEQPGPMPADPSAGFYVPALPATIRWGHLPNRGAQPVLSVPSGSIVTFDTVSHEGVLEDQGRD
ncbi:MAG TPA: acetamidase, partial [Gammaproteobacteria bacterium]|nr:acetamidase [Gammaproteobacteria bacterium]